MASGQEMPKVDLVKDRPLLTQAQLNYMRLAQQQNAGKGEQKRDLFPTKGGGRMARSLNLERDNCIAY